jgi:GGDEF domain-containing protein
MSSFLANEEAVVRLGPHARKRVGGPLMARLLAVLFAAGATLSLLTLPLAHSRGANTPGVLVVVGCAYLVAGLLFWRAQHMPIWQLQLALGLGSSLITLVAYLSANSPSPLISFYLWVFLYSAYFLSRRQMAAQAAYVGVAYAVLLALRVPASQAPTWWIVFIGTLLVAAVLVQVMRRHVELLIARLFDAARTDPLTKLSNRRGFHELLDLELERARRGERPMTVLVGDVDHFKEVNDRSGHHVGDAVLCRVAGILQDSKRQIDAAARIGGEEFALICPDTDAQTAFVLAERLRCWHDSVGSVRLV